jgi:hypothetical protein
MRRLDIVLEFLRAFAGRGVYNGSREHLLPVRFDFKCLVPMMYGITPVIRDAQPSLSALVRLLPISLVQRQPG